MNLEPSNPLENNAVPVAANDSRPVSSNSAGAATKQAMIQEIASWKGVSVHDHRFGGIEFRVGRRELGHLHPKFADLPFTRRTRDELITAGRARPHHVLPDSGWVTVPMRTAQEMTNVVELFRKNYEHAVAAQTTPQRTGPEST
jgi:luciferase-like monooxygenase